MSDQIPTNKEKNTLNTARTLAIALEFGFIIAIPLLVLTLVGKWLSSRYQNELFLYAGIILAIVSSVAFLSIRINKIYKELIKK